MKRTYRADIDGLRAISVACVILFHLNVPGFGGGFIGVDVFFVISGFLITGLIIENIERDVFSFIRFYERRARRILPMLITVVIASAGAGYFFLMPGDYKALGSSAIAALLAWSNFYFLHHTGYFDIPSQTMPLLHTWSLGVEEQFYLAWPAVLLAGSKAIGRSRIAWISLLILIILASFASALTMSDENSKAAFYSPFPRAWELAVGSLIVFLPRPRGRFAEVMPIIGIAAIAISVSMLSAAAPFPRYNALLPTVGAALILYPRETVTQTILGLRPLRFLGLISYSLYLWHWPLIVFWRIYNNGQPVSPWNAFPSLVTAAVALSILSWYLIEQPARRVRMPSVALFGSAAAASAVALIAAFSIVRSDGFPTRLPSEMAAIDSKDKMWAWACPQSVDVGILANGSMTTAPSCAYGADWKTARHHAVIWGDSLAEHLAPELDYAGRKVGTAIALAYACTAITQEGAPRSVASDLTPNYEKWCDAARDRVLTLIASTNDIDIVLLSTSWSYQWPVLDAHSEKNGRKILQKGLGDLLERIIGAGKRPIVIADAAADLGPDPTSCVIANYSSLARRPCLANPAYIELTGIRSQVDTHAMLKELVARYPEAGFVDPMEFLCNQTRCQTFINDEFIYRDSVHLRRNLRPTTVSDLAAGLKLQDVLTRGKD
jgi:peptidoglycan/LPS O-acetylase OafA/YrhL